MFIGTMVDLALLLFRSHRIQVGQSHDPFTVRNRRQAAGAFYDVAREAHRTHGKALKEQKLQPGQLERAWRWYQMKPGKACRFTATPGATMVGGCPQQLRRG